MRILLTGGAGFTPYHRCRTTRVPVAYQRREPSRHLMFEESRCEFC